MEAVCIPCASSCAISPLPSSRCFRPRNSRLVSASPGAVPPPWPSLTELFFVPQASSSPSCCSNDTIWTQHGHWGETFPAAAAGAGVAVLCLVAARRHTLALLLLPCFILAIVYIPLRGYSKSLRDTASSLLKLMPFETAKTWPSFIVRTIIMNLSISESTHPLYGGNDNGDFLSSSINRKLDGILSDISTRVCILKHTVFTDKLSSSDALYVVDELYKTSQSLKALHISLLSKEGSQPLSSGADAGDVGKRLLYNGSQSHEHSTSKVNGIAAEIQSHSKIEKRNFQTANVEQTSMRLERMPVVNCDEGIIAEASETQKDNAESATESNDIDILSKDAVKASPSDNETLNVGSIEALADLPEGKQILGFNSVLLPRIDMDAQTDSTLTDLTSRYTSGKDTVEESTNFQLTGSFGKVDRVDSWGSRALGDRASFKQSAIQNCLNQGGKDWHSKTDFWQSFQLQESKNHCPSPSSTDDNLCSIEMKQVVAVERNTSVERDWWTGEGQYVEPLDATLGVSEFQRKHDQRSNGELKDKKNGSLFDQKNVLETEGTIRKLNYPDKVETQTRMLENSKLESVIPNADKCVENSSVISVDNAYGEAYSEPATNHGDEKAFTETETMKSIKSGEKVMVSQHDFQTPEVLKSPLESENLLGTLPEKSPLLHGWSNKKEDKEFRRLMDEGEALLNEAKGGLNGNADVGLSESKFYNAADRFALASAMNSSSLEAIGLWGNTLLLHGEFKLNLSRKLHRRIILAGDWAHESGRRRSWMNMDVEEDAILQKLQTVSEECENLLVEAGRKYRKALSINRTDIRALYNWGLALCFRAQLIMSEGSENAAVDADKLYLAAIDKFEAMMGINQTTYALGALLNWGLALRDRSRLRPMGSRDRKKFLLQAKQLFLDALQFDTENSEASGAVMACNVELKELQAYEKLLIRTRRKPLKWSWWDQK